jgi:hypothetical protein
MGTFSAGSSTTCDPCDDGYVCKSGSVTATPTESQCPAGFYCQHDTATVEVKACAAGTYNSRGVNTNVGACLNCPLGRWCARGTGEPQPCPPGAYCPLRTESNTQYAVRDGHYISNFFEEKATTAEVICPPGYYCDKGAVYPIKCPTGFYCTEGSTSNPAAAAPPYVPAGHPSYVCAGAAAAGFEVDPSVQ